MTLTVRLLILASSLASKTTEKRKEETWQLKMIAK
jgi:hypothetical protein